jgi:hypothetical protein
LSPEVALEETSEGLAVTGCQAFHWWPQFWQIATFSLVYVVLLFDFFLPNSNHNPQVQIIKSNLPRPNKHPFFLVFVTAPV